MNARQDYSASLDSIAQRLDLLDRRLGLLVWVRTILFFTGIAFFLLGYLGPVAPGLTRPLSWIFAAGFLAAIVWNEHLRFSQQNALSDRCFFDRLIARLDRNWSALPRQIYGKEVTPPMSREDLDIDGESSLLTFFSLAVTPAGMKRLQQWLANPCEWSEINARQMAVQRLAPLRSLRLEIMKTLNNTSFGGTHYGLADWADSPNWFSRHRFAAALSWCGPSFVIGGAFLMLMNHLVLPDVVPNESLLMNGGFVLLGLGMSINILVTLLWGGWIHGIFATVCGGHRSTIEYAEVFQWTRQLPKDNGILDGIRNTCVEQPLNATEGFGQLNRLVQLASLQKNILLYVVYLALQLTTLWDLHVLRSLERWKRKFGPHVREWFEALGTCEALISGATLADENPEWVFPEACEQPDLALQVEGLAHPLLSDNQRVANDLVLRRSKPVLLVTGSNMAGKSTFLRSLGVNVILARTGSPVCATLMRIPPFEIASSIRVRDSLREGVSFFMAELRRLKSVVDLARNHSAPGQPPLLFLLDEILQGTNSRERQIAVLGVLEQLIELGACGLISTHDLDLADIPFIKNVCQIVHFREFFETDSSGQQNMKFDYVMRPGVTPTTNALRLLQMVGLNG
jgi:predicted ATPase